MFCHGLPTLQTQNLTDLIVNMMTYFMHVFSSFFVKNPNVLISNFTIKDLQTCMSITVIGLT